MRLVPPSRATWIIGALWLGLWSPWAQSADSIAEIPPAAAPDQGAVEGVTETPQEVPAETAAPVEAAPTDDLRRQRAATEAPQDVYEPPTINGVPVESGTYDVDGGVVRDASGDSIGSANADGPNIVEGDIKGGGTFIADGGAGTGTDEDTAPAEAAPAPAAPAESAPAPDPAPAPESTTTTTTSPDGTGTLTTTTTINGIQMEDGVSTTFGNAQGEGASAAPGEVTYGG